MAKFRRFEGAFSWFFIGSGNCKAFCGAWYPTTAQRPNCSYNKDYIALFYCACAKRPDFRFRFENVFSWFFFHRKSKKSAIFLLPVIWPTDLESVPRVEPPTLFISIKFLVDTTIHRRVTALLEWIRYVTLWPWPFDPGQWSNMAGHVVNPFTKFEDPTPIRSWLMCYDVRHRPPLTMRLEPLRMLRITWRVRRGVNFSQIFEIPDPDLCIHYATRTALRSR